MLIDADVFAQMLGVKPGVLVFAIKTGGLIKGHKPPSPVKPDGRWIATKMKFDLDEASAFEKIISNSGQVKQSV
ncbi:hypothetical protein AB6870_21290 [Rahnella inusitata]|uniref:hypothetical protein n=1 Tax=Rahnella inusitata TaxID=58169 RepID=UPI0039BE645A